jgi:capsular polysaccharide biosynthesis protein
MISDRERSRSIRTVEDEQVISLRDILRVLRIRIWLIGIVIVLALGTTLGLTFFQTQEYQASVKVLIGQDSGFVGSNGNVQQLEDLTQTMAQAIATQPVAEEVIRQQGLNLTPEALMGRLEAIQVPNTQFIQVHYRDTDPVRAQAVVNAIGEVFSEQVTDVSPDVSAVTATVWESAAVPGQPTSPNIQRNIALGLVIGVMLGVGLAFLLEYLDKSPLSRENEAGFRQVTR